jgi:hypothetical protein
MREELSSHALQSDEYMTVMSTVMRTVMGTMMSTVKSTVSNAWTFFALIALRRAYDIIMDAVQVI